MKKTKKIRRISNPIERLTEICFAKAALEAHRCPYLKTDPISSYCSKDLKCGEQIGECRRMICDDSSTQTWCLNEERYPACRVYKGELVL